MTFHHSNLKPLTADRKLKQFLFILYLVLAVLLISSLIVQHLYTRAGVISGIYIEEVIFTSKLDSTGWPIDPISGFSPTTDRIYCFLNIRGVFGLPMGGVILVKWFYGPEQIRAHYFHTDSEPAILWLEPVVNENFRSGRYTVEIFINQTLVRSAEFEVQ